MAKFLLIPHFEMHNCILDRIEGMLHKAFDDMSIETNKTRVKFRGPLHALLPRDGYYAIEVIIPNFKRFNVDQNKKMSEVLVSICGESSGRAVLLIRIDNGPYYNNAEILTKQNLITVCSDGYTAEEKCHIIKYSVINTTSLGNPMGRTQIANNISNLFQKLSNLDYIYGIIYDEYSQIILTSNDEVYYEGDLYASLESEDD